MQNWTSLLELGRQKNTIFKNDKKNHVDMEMQDESPSPPHQETKKEQ